MRNIFAVISFFLSAIATVITAEGFVNWSWAVNGGTFAWGIGLGIWLTGSLWAEMG
jgi:hypothetical protein